MSASQSDPAFPVDRDATPADADATVAHAAALLSTATSSHDALELAGRRIVVGLTGGIACYKAAELTRELVRRGAEVHVAMTEGATHFITPLTMQALSGRPVHLDQWRQDGNGMAHIDLSRGADAIVIAPASADFMAKLACGIADDLLLTLCLARNCKLLVAPAMNREMWAKPATTRNVAQLRDDGVEICGPGSGAQACGEVGDGRMLEAGQIADALCAALRPKLLAGRHVVLTAGPTFEPLDPVRGLTNRSSGKMGFALARAAADAGASVDLVAGPVALPTPWGVRRHDIETASEMRAAVLSLVPHADVFIGVAAVCDWRAAEIATDKIKKSVDAAPPRLALAENPDILAEVAARPDAPYCVGFAAESSDLLKLAAAKRVRKGVPLLVGNLGQQTFGRDDNEVVLFDADGPRALPRTGKAVLAHALIAEIARRLPRRPPP
ncbi:bifunctional phosphopantothenoylcysteine decarboxylase/phosphopantothenate--cysteine ligase CoaBC [Chitinasiproducens palmae]|uniref:Coenzyme A biosynthesis bifunctional protein CoaBC n=1 Tax=Chitinasiproducens palmae TaxID=1770053 RepID=A0A1H2PT28_9BURK|nr:bifunctional phosphopantothenoylcysteine decarboxylase/phosphopantothenate--cysteine ligase CoaBC [Chitinasiproducens palmae]SDV49380.1 Phosphopantothenate-cysteine ligase /Phosphopantothenoylcysteine decarboxylase [Chitinasiproducens palmae]